MNAITKPRNPLSAPKKQPRIMSKRQAVATARSGDGQAKEQGTKATTGFEMRGPHGTSAALRQCLAGPNEIGRSDNDFLAPYAGAHAQFVLKH